MLSRTSAPRSISAKAIFLEAATSPDSYAFVLASPPLAAAAAAPGRASAIAHPAAPPSSVVVQRASVGRHGPRCIGSMRIACSWAPRRSARPVCRLWRRRR